MTKKLSPLPASEDWEEEAEKYMGKAVPMPICETHARDKWQEHRGYVDNRDGTASCKFCGWGFKIPGYMRIQNEKVMDLRDL